jgi:DNA repair protein RadD
MSLFDLNAPEIILRPYQEECLQVIKTKLREKPNVLLEMATGGGKTIIFSSLVKDLLEDDPNYRIAISAHRQELVTQAKDKLHRVWPESYGIIGVACASIEKVETNFPVVIGSVQTLARRTFPRSIDLLIIDEVHRVPAFKEKKISQYQSLIEKIRSQNPKASILGVTATPYRLDKGYIYGHEDDFFDCVDYRIGLDDLIADNWLVPIRAKETGYIEEINFVERGINGDYKQDALSKLLTKEVHIQSAVSAYLKYGEGRKNALAFAVTIEHAELMTDAFNVAGVKSAVIHSELHDLERSRVLRDFEDGKIEVLVNVGILTEGWDSPRVDLILLTRPTLSPGLFVQMIGRGTRLFQGKKNLLVLDLVGNFMRHDVPWNPRVVDKSNKKDKGDLKTCPCCQLMMEKNARYCPECEYEFPIIFSRPKELQDSEERPLYELSFEELTRINVLVDSWFLSGYFTKKNRYMLKLDIRVTSLPGEVQIKNAWISHYLDIEGTSSSYGQKKAQIFWYKYGKIPAPRTVEEALKRKLELNIGGKVKLTKDNGFLKVNAW